MVHCVWDTWTLFECSASCDGGTRKKTRTKVITEVNSKCGGKNTMYEPCNLAKCEDKCPFLVFINNVSLCSSLEFCKLKIFFLFLLLREIQCEWSSWFSGGCSRTCGGGNLTMIRHKTQVEVNTKCNGDSIKQMQCNTEECPSKSVVYE